MNLGGWAISKELYSWIRSNLKDDSIILELGSGEGTGELAKNYKIYSVENNKQWLNKYDSTYIYAPIINYGHYRWFQKRIALPDKYDLILVDAPTGDIGRMGFYYNLSLFNTDVPIIIDDTNRSADMDLAVRVSTKLKKKLITIKGDEKWFSVII